MVAEAEPKDAHGEDLVLITSIGKFLADEGRAADRASEAAEGSRVDAVLWSWGTVPPVAVPPPSGGTPLRGRCP